MQPLPEDPLLHAAAIAYFSDSGMIATVASVLGIWQPGGATASLDHAIWFHRPLRADRWHLHALQGQGLTGGRALALGRVYDGDGLHVATVAQEILVRERRDG